MSAALQSRPPGQRLQHPHGIHFESGIEIAGKSLDIVIGDGDISQVISGIYVKDQSENVHIRDVESGGNVVSFNYGIELAGNNARISGNHVALNSESSFAIGLSADRCGSGLHIDRHVHDSNIRDVMWGIIAGGGDITHFVTPGTVISHNQIYATRGGIKVDRMSSLAITHNTIHRIEDADFIGIDINPGIDPDGDPTTPPHADSGAHRIIGNFIFAPAGGTSTKQGIVIQHDENDNVIEGNITVNMQRGIWLMNAAIDGTLVLGNINKNSTTAAIVNGGTNTLLAHNH